MKLRMLWFREDILSFNFAFATAERFYCVNGIVKEYGICCNLETHNLINGSTPCCKASNYVNWESSDFLPWYLLSYMNSNSSFPCVWNEVLELHHSPIINKV